MKKQLNNTMLILATGLVAVLPPMLVGQESGLRKARTSEMTLATGTPYHASIAYSYAFSDGLAAGFDIAKPNQGLTFGLNVVGDVYRGGDTRFFSDAELTYKKSVNNVAFGISWLLISPCSRKSGSLYRSNLYNGLTVP
ncbi:MAG: hypothetical protein WBD36_12690 [Bacteroidota bacterium]